MTTEEFIAKRLEELKQILTVRRDNYAPPPLNFKRIAAYWTIDFEKILRPGAVVTPLEVSQAMISVKKARILNGYTADSAQDLAGYALCMEVCEELKEELRFKEYGKHIAVPTVDRIIPETYWVDRLGE